MQTEDEQAFLSKQQQILQQQGQTPIRGESPMRVQGSTGKTPTRPVGPGDNRSPVKVLLASALSEMSISIMYLNLFLGNWPNTRWYPRWRRGAGEFL